MPAYEHITEDLRLYEEVGYWAVVIALRNFIQYYVYRIKL